MKEDFIENEKPVKAGKKLYLIDLSNYEDLKDKKNRSINFFGFPLGLMSIATFLKKNLPSLDTRILDYGIDYLTEEELINIIKRGSPSYLGFRALSSNEKILINITAKIKTLFPNILIIVGGPHVSNLNEGEFKKINADIFVIGEGEITALELFDKILNNKNYENIDGTVIKKNKIIIINRKRELIENFDNVPFPNYDLIDFEKYFNKFNWGYTKSKYALIESSRGCPYQCIYCHNIFDKKTRLRSSDAIFNEIKRLHEKYKIEDFFFVDDIFNIDYKRAEEIFNKIIHYGIKVNLHFPNGLRGDLLDKNLIDKMVSAGTISLAYAVETPSQRLQKYINKNLNLSKLKDNIDYTCDKGIMVRLFFMYGFPTETEKEVEDTISYMKQFKKCVIPYLYVAKFYRNSKMYTLAIQEGFSINELERSQLGLYNEVQFCETPLLSRNFMKKIHYKWLKEIMLNKERMLYALSIQRKYHTDEEIVLFYSSFFGRDIKNMEEIISICN